MIQTIRKAWNIPELRKKDRLYLLILLIYRIGNAIPVPYVDVGALSEYLNSMKTTVLGLYNVMSGGAFADATVFALSIQPYINASIIIQLLTVAIPALERMAREEGEEGRKKIASITRYTTVGIGLIQGFAYYMLMRNQYNILTNDSIAAAFVIIVTFVAGSAFIMWLGEQITEFGIGNGISIILFASIISPHPRRYRHDVQQPRGAGRAWYRGHSGGPAGADRSDHARLQRRAPYSRAVCQASGGPQDVRWPEYNAAREGQHVRCAAHHFCAVHRHAAGYHCRVPACSAGGSFWYGFIQAIDTKSVLYMLAYFLMIIGFSYFYATIQFNPTEIANNLKRNGGFIPGFRPGKPTADFIAKVLSVLRCLVRSIWALWQSLRWLPVSSSAFRVSPSAAPPSSSLSALRWKRSRRWKPDAGPPVQGFP